MKSGFSLNPDAVEFNFSTDFSVAAPWNTQASDFVPFEPPAVVEAPVLKPAKKIYTYEVLISLRELHKQLPEGVVIPETYSKTGKSKSSKKGSQPTKQSAIKRAENQLNSLTILVKSEKPFTEKVKKQADELEKKSREIRSILNKLTQRNFDKLLDELTNFEYDTQLLANLTNFIFERATAMNFPSLYSKLCASLRKNFKSNNLSSNFRKSIVEKCRECFYNEDLPMENDKLMEAEFKRRRRLIGNIKFIALLHQVKMIKSEIMFECFEVLLNPKSLSDETLETCITLFKDTAPLLVGKFADDVAKYYEKILAMMNVPGFCKRILFMIQDLVECKDQLLIPQKISTVKEIKKTEPAEEVEPVQEEEPEKKLSEIKNQIKNLTKVWHERKMDEDFNKRLRDLFKKNETMHIDLAVQVLKYGLYECNSKDIVSIFELIQLLIREIGLDGELFKKGLVIVENDLEEIKIDSPLVGEVFQVLKSTLDS